jgi:hypothetical protein
MVAAKKHWGVRSSGVAHGKNLPNILKANLSNHLPQWILAAVSVSLVI